ncbi:MAG: HD domain-containing protein [Acidobacteriota bacterium]
MVSSNPVSAHRPGLNVLLRAFEFAADKHRDKRRKGIGALPYINHLIEVTSTLANVGGVDDTIVLMAAVLHDTVEDTKTTPEEIEAAFGREVRSIVLEVTDDKSLPKAERKRLQVEHAPHLSAEARMIKLADKIANVREVSDGPPPDWPLARRQEYADWAEQVVAGCRGVNPALEARFDETLRRARQIAAREG